MDSKSPTTLPTEKTPEEVLRALSYGDIRQVSVYYDGGGKTLPCIPATGSTHQITSLPNGTLLKYTGHMTVPSALNSSMIFLMFDVMDNMLATNRIVLLSTSNIQYLWPARIRLPSGRKRR